MATLTVITGPMFSGKSGELLREARNHGYAGRKVIAIKPKQDDRQATIRARQIIEGQSTTVGEFPAFEVNNEEELDKLILTQWPNVVLFDEFQFFDIWVLNWIRKILRNPRNALEIYAAGLDQNSELQTFGCMGDLLAIADHVIKLKAVCFRCGAPATTTTRIAPSTGQAIQTGDNDKYIATCRRCHQA
jgi:thymidine kinase